MQVLSKQRDNQAGKDKSIGASGGGWLRLLTEASHKGKPEFLFIREARNHLLVRLKRKRSNGKRLLTICERE